MSTSSCIVNIHLDSVALNFSEFPLVLEGGPGALELLGELLGVGLQSHAAQLLLHLANLNIKRPGLEKVKSIEMTCFVVTLRQCDMCLFGALLRTNYI